MKLNAHLSTGDTVIGATLNANVHAMSGLELGHALIWDTLGRIAVDVADEAEADNTRPITAAAVFTELGNINVLLKTI